MVILLLEVYRALLWDDSVKAVLLRIFYLTKFSSERLLYPQLHKTFAAY